MNIDIVKKAYNQLEFDVVIGVDKGMDYLVEAEITPDVLLGDYDSCNPVTLDALKNGGTKVLAYPSEKDMTDTHLCFDYAIGLGVKHVVLFGATGGRLDHSLSNIFVLEKYCGQLEIVLYDSKNMFYLANGEARLAKMDYKYISLVPLSDKVEGVNFTGVKYPLTNATLFRADSYGISNEISDQEAFLTYSSGTLLVVYSKD